MERYGRFSFADGKRFITDYVAIAREIAAATGEFYFTFACAKHFTHSFGTAFAVLFLF